MRVTRKQFLLALFALPFGKLKPKAKPRAAGLSIHGVGLMATARGETFGLAFHREAFTMRNTLNCCLSAEAEMRTLRIVHPDRSTEMITVNA
jgi:hypothetical protein